MTLSDALVGTALKPTTSAGSDRCDPVRAGGRRPSARRAGAAQRGVRARSAADVRTDRQLVGRQGFTQPRSTSERFRSCTPRNA